jgi:hypothetical protein
MSGQSHGPAQFGRKPGLVSEPAPGFILANHVAPGNPSDLNSVVPRLDKFQRAIDRVHSPKRCQVDAVACDLGVNDTAWRQALQA